MSSPTTFAASRNRFGSGSSFRWTLRHQPSGRLVRISQAAGPESDGFSESNATVHVRLGDIPRAPSGAYDLTLEVRHDAGRPEAWSSSATAIPVEFVPEILTTTGIAPGRVIAGHDQMVLYGRRLSGARVEIEGPFEEPSSDAPCSAGGCKRRPILATADRRGTVLTFDISAGLPPGFYRAVARRGSLRSRPQWFRIEPERVEPSGRPDRRGTARPLLSGQTVRERFEPRGTSSSGLWNSQVYLFVATAGSRVDARLSRVDTSRTWEHPDSLDPELYLVAPDHTVYGHFVGTDIQPGVDLNAQIREALPTSGIYFLVASTSKGFGEYDLTFALEPAELCERRESAILMTDALGMIRAGMTERSVWAILDPRGYPLSGAAVDFVPTPESAKATFVFVNGGAATSNVHGLVSASFRLDSKGLIAVPAALYGCALADPVLRPGDGGPRKIAIPRLPLAAAATTLVREVDLVSGDALLSEFGFQKF